MDSSQPSTPQLSPEQVKFKEAYDLHMPPYDFKIWDKYLFSRCSSGEEVLGLFNLFRWLMESSEYAYNAKAIDQFCAKGDAFIEAVKNIIDMAKDTWMNPEEIRRDLAFIKEHQAKFSAGPMHLSAVGEKEQKAWRDQAKACILSKSRHSATPVEIYTPAWFTKQEAYFAFGVLAWKIRQDPGWGWEDSRLDVWWKLGFGIATQKGTEDELFNQYQKHFSFERVKFEYFLYSWCRGELAKKLQDGLVSEHSIFWDYLTRFYDKETTSEEIIVFRLYQAVSLMDDDYARLMGRRSWGIFENARACYQLNGWPYEEDRCEEKRKAITRKRVLYQVLKHIEDPIGLHKAMKSRKLRDFITQTYKAHGMHPSESTLNEACCDY